MRGNSKSMWHSTIIDLISDFSTKLGEMDLVTRETSKLMEQYNL